MSDLVGKVNRGRILICSATVGSGHNSAASAVERALHREGLGKDLHRVDGLQFCPRYFRAFYAGGFALMMTRLPWLYGLGFKLTNRPHTPDRGLGERVRLWHERRALLRFRRYLRDLRPELIIHTHFLASPVVAWMMDQNRLETTQLVTMTDIEPHRYWYSERVNHYFAPHEHTTEMLKRWGIDESRITVSGIPIHGRWTEPLDVDRIYDDWNLPRDKKIVLFSGGTEFTCGPVVKMCNEILQARRDTFVVLLAGRNKKLLSRAARHPEAGNRLMPVGFTDRNHELVEVAELMVTKAGGITTAECLAKGTPMVLYCPVPGQEGGNARYLAGKDAAVIAPNYSDVAPRVAAMLDDEQHLFELRQNARDLYHPATDLIVEKVRNVLTAD
ncbi:MAG: MGDG synthase family glycosyltransferase [Phycisphaerae bacterium]